MKEALDELDAAQIDFICKECEISKEKLHSLDEDELYDLVYDDMCDIELEEISAADDVKESERCEIASSIVTALGNALAKEQGMFDEDNLS